MSMTEAESMFRDWQLRYNDGKSPSFKQKQVQHWRSTVLCIPLQYGPVQAPEPGCLVGLQVERIDPLFVLAGCRNVKGLNQALSFLSLLD